MTLVKRPLPPGVVFAALKSALGLVIGPLMLGLCSRRSPASDPTSESLSPEQSLPSVSSHKDTEMLRVFYLRCSTPWEHPSFFTIFLSGKKLKGNPVTGTALIIGNGLSNRMHRGLCRRQHRGCLSAGFASAVNTLLAGATWTVRLCA